MSLIDLLPEDYIQRKRAQRSNRLCLALFVVVMAGVLAAAFISQHCRKNTQGVLDRVDNDYQQATVLMSELTDLQQRKATMMDKARSTSKLLERVPRSYLLAMITNSLPQNASLVNISLYPKRVVTAADASPTKDAKFAAKSAQAAADGKTIVEMEVAGLADTDVAVARFIANLARNPLADSVDLAYSQEKSIDLKDPAGQTLATGLVREFQVRIALKNDVDVIDVLGKPLAQAGTAAPAEGGQP
jgi:Tfp pilus assembly protein PilN